MVLKNRLEVGKLYRICCRMYILSIDIKTQLNIYNNNNNNRNMIEDLGKSTFVSNKIKCIDQ